MSALAAPTPRELCRDALAREIPALPAGLCGVTMPLERRARADGLIELIDAASGESRGVCASAAIAAGTINFFR